MFALGLHPVVMRLHECGFDINVWYLDDGVLCGTVAAVKHALELLKRYLPQAGLELNPLKCKLFDPAADVNDPVFDGILFLLAAICLLKGQLTMCVPNCIVYFRRWHF